MYIRLKHYKLPLNNRRHHNIPTNVKCNLKKGGKDHTVPKLTPERSISTSDPSERAESCLLFNYTNVNAFLQIMTHF